MVLFVLCLGAELIANDRPLLIVYKGDAYIPVFIDYPETRFGGEFEAPADYRDPYVRDLIIADGWMVWPPIPFSYRTINYDLPTPAPSPPDAVNWLGTDDQGRDVLARIIYGFRISVVFGLILTILSSVVGVIIGAVQGYFAGMIDLLGQRIIEIWASTPQLYLLIIIASIFTPSFLILLTVLLLFSWMSLVGYVRAECLRARNFDYVRAAVALGEHPVRVLFKHVLPNALVATVTFMPFILIGSVTTLTSLDFLGLGMPPGSPSLGELLNQGKNNLQAPWLAAAGFLTMAIMLCLLFFIGEAIRDAFDPRKVNI